MSKKLDESLSKFFGEESEEEVNIKVDFKREESTMEDVPQEKKDDVVQASDIVESLKQKTDSEESWNKSEEILNKAEEEAKTNSENSSINLDKLLETMWDSAPEESTVEEPEAAKEDDLKEVIEVKEEKTIEKVLENQIEEAEEENNISDDLLSMLGDDDDDDGEKLSDGMEDELPKNVSFEETIENAITEETEKIEEPIKSFDDDSIKEVEKTEEEYVYEEAEPIESVISAEPESIEEESEEERINPVIFENILASKIKDLKERGDVEEITDFINTISEETEVLYELVQNDSEEIEDLDNNLLINDVSDDYEDETEITKPTKKNIKDIIKENKKVIIFFIAFALIGLVIGGAAAIFI